jgi:phosphoglycerol transferase
MDNQFFKSNMESGYKRRVYNCFINSRVTPKDAKNRTFTPMDIFPTTLAALGCEIKNERLGLGTNLFSTTKTLAEEMTLKKLNSELNKSSKYYKQNFILK